MSRFLIKAKPGNEGTEKEKRRKAEKTSIPLGLKGRNHGNKTGWKISFFPGKREIVSGRRKLVAKRYATNAH